VQPAASIFLLRAGADSPKISKLRTVCFKRLLIYQEYNRSTSYAFTARMLPKNITLEMSGKKAD
jgi:hypothetical protein